MKMINRLNEISARAPMALVQDAVGVASLAVILVVGLHLPTFI